MARTVQDSEEAIKPVEAQLQPVAFVKNQTNEIVILPDGSQFKFAKSLELVTDPKIIDGLRAVAGKFSIFEA